MHTEFKHTLCRYRNITHIPNRDDLKANEGPTIMSAVIRVFPKQIKPRWMEITHDYRTNLIKLKHAFPYIL